VGFREKGGDHFWGERIGDNKVAITGEGGELFFCEALGS